MKLKFLRFGLFQIIVVVTFFSFHAFAQGQFRFEDEKSLYHMQEYIKNNFKVGSPRSELMDTFVVNGKATLVKHPSQPSVEKYIYDINLCDYYIWRWNISADYDENGAALQIYVNGEPVLKDGTPKKIISKEAEEGKKASIYKAQRPRPEAAKGEKSLGFILFDRDSDNTTVDDQAVIGAGPSQPMAENMGKMITYQDVSPWRSIFDFDEADFIAPYSGDCKAADAAIANQHPVETHEHKGMNSKDAVGKIIEGVVQ